MESVFQSHIVRGGIEGDIVGIDGVGNPVGEAGVGAFSGGAGGLAVSDGTQGRRHADGNPQAIGLIGEVVFKGPPDAGAQPLTSHPYPGLALGSFFPHKAAIPGRPRGDARLPAILHLPGMRRPPAQLLLCGRATHTARVFGTRR